MNGKAPSYIQIIYMWNKNNKVRLSTAQGEPDFCRKMKPFGYK